MRTQGRFFLISDPVDGSRLTQYMSPRFICYTVSRGHIRAGVGRSVVESLIAKAGALGVQRVFCLTFEVEFFRSLGFSEISGTPISAEVYTQLLQSEDEGVAEFLDLERVKPNTLGNTRMLRRLPLTDIR